MRACSFPSLLAFLSMPSTSVATELTYSIALSFVKYIGPRTAIELLEAVGSATALFMDAELRARSSL